MEVPELVDIERGLVSRRIYVDEDIYQRELEWAAMMEGKSWAELGEREGGS